MLKVLIVDDEIDICYLLSGMLKQKDFESSYVNTLKDATEVLEHNIPDLIFLDNHLPDGLGMDYIKFIKAHYSTVKIIMITAHDTGIERKKALNNGADMFLGKPLSRNLIFSTVDQVILQHSR